MAYCQFCAGYGKTLERVICSSCKDLNSKRYDCKVCEGKGAFTEEVTCSRCNGTLRVPDTGNFVDDKCFIATATYGDFNAPEVIFLREFRDSLLNQNALGRGFIRAYYKVSPHIANIIVRSKSLRKIVRKFFLQPLIFTLKKLQRK